MRSTLSPVFLSTLSLRRATLMWYQCNTVVKISIHALLAESDGRQQEQNGVLGISIHALLAESDPFSRSGRMTRRYFYPRSPCGERPVVAYFFAPQVIFLSTLSLRRATTGNIGWVGTARHFYPRSPCGERHHYGWSWYDDFTISIHALLAESDTSLVVIGTNCVISIHALLAESDLSIHLQALAGHHFYPRSPCGERLLVTSCMPVSGDFYPRSPCGERPAMGKPTLEIAYFYPRSPCGERRGRPA